MKVSIPDFALVILMGPTGSGKSSFARKHFLESEIVSSDRCRALVCDDEADQSSTGDAFDLLRYTAGVRLKRRRLTVIDATSVQKEDRAQLVKLAREFHALPVALAFDIDPKICHERNKGRENRDFGAQVPRKHSAALRRGLRGLQKDGCRQSTSCDRRKTSMPQKSPVSRCGLTGDKITAHLTSSETFMVVSMN